VRAEHPAAYKASKRESQRKQRAKMTRTGIRRSGYTKKQIDRLVTRDILVEAIELVRSTASRADLLQVIPRAKLDAFKFFHPKIRPKLSILKAQARLAKIITPESIIAAPAISERSPASTERVMQRCAKAVARNLQRDLRDDVISDMVLAWRSGQLNARDIVCRAIEFERVRFRSDHNRYGDRSLDVPIYVDGGVTLLDTLSTEAGFNYWDPNMTASTGRRK
jgi:hypothetical protein